MSRWLNRREWLAASAAGAAGLWLAGCDDDPPTGYGPFSVGFQSYSLRFFQDLDGFRSAAGELGLPWVELYPGHRGLAAPDASLRAQLSASGLDIAGYGVVRFGVDDAANRLQFEIAAALGASMITANPEVAVVAGLVGLVEEFNISVAIHNHGPTDDRWAMPEQVMAAVAGLDERIGACVDTGHYLRSGVDPVAAIDMLGARVLAVHLKDVDTEDNDVIIGDARLDVPGVVASLDRIGFAGPLSLEYEADMEAPVAGMVEGLRRLRAAIVQVA